MIRFFDQNIWCNKVIANRNSLICRMIKRYSADIIALQECRPSTHRVGDTDIGMMLSAKYAEAMPEILDRNHTPIFYRRARFDVLDSGYELFEGLNNINSKSISWAAFYDKVDDCSFAAVSTHFWYKAEDEADFAQRIENVHQLKSCCDRILQKHDVPIVVMGDLNCGINASQGEEPYYEMLRVGMRDIRRIAARTTDRLTHHALPTYNEEEGIFTCNELPVKNLDYAFAYGKDNASFHSFNVLYEQMALDSSDHCPLVVEMEIKKEKRNFVNFAHRGASEYAPENTVSSFSMGIEMGANGIETDVQITKDGVLVLFHDDTLARVTAREGTVADYTYEELLQMRVRNENTGREDVILRFEDFLRYFGWRDLTFAIEIKHPGYEREVVEMLNRFDMREKTVITSFNFSCIAEVKKVCPEFCVGWLMKDYSEEGNAQLHAIGGEQMCPQAKYLTPEKVAAWKAQGFGVRAWGIGDSLELMKHAYLCGADGMTINYPDKLTEYLNEQ